MARRAIISDIHSNLLALEAVLADIRTQNVDGIVCLGDICGYGPQPIECIELVRGAAMWTLMGNHDEALFVDPKDFGKNARLAVEWQKRILEPPLESTQVQEDRWFWLQNLQPRRVEDNVLFVHASPREPLYEYVLREDFLDEGMGPSEKAKELFAATEWLCFCGHSHRPGVVSEDYRWYRPEELTAGTHILKRGQKTIVNVGSVGQPRDAITAACYCIFDLTEPADLLQTVQTPAPRLAEQPPELVKTQRVSMPGQNTGDAPEALPQEEIGSQDDTRTTAELQKARETVMLSLPRVTFRRVAYDVAAEQERFRAVPDLPEHNAARLGRGL